MPFTFCIKKEKNDYAIVAVCQECLIGMSGLFFFQAIFTPNNVN